MQPVTKRIIRTIASIDQAIPDSSKGLRTLYSDLSNVLESLLHGERESAKEYMLTFQKRLASPPSDVDREIVAMFKNDTVPLIETLIENRE
jgi:hypothetical protein